MTALHTKWRIFYFAKLARFMSALAIVIVVQLPLAADGQSLKDKCEKARKRDSYMETQLKNGTILIAGGFERVMVDGQAMDKPGAVAKAEICDPATGKLSPTGSMIVPRCCASATLLQNGQVLIAGGTSPLSAKSLNSAEMYDPATGTFTQVGAMIIGRSGHTATLLNNGRVLIAGGSQNPRGAFTTPTAELYNPNTKSFEPTGGMHSSRSGHTATLTSEGKVLIAGGYTQGGPAGMSDRVRTSELYDPQTGTFSLIGSSEPP
jgi:galactose oxidase-like protein